MLDEPLQRDVCAQRETQGFIFRETELKAACSPDSPTDVVSLFAGDGVTADLSVLDGRQIPEVDKEAS